MVSLSRKWILLHFVLHAARQRVLGFHSKTKVQRTVEYLSSCTRILLVLTQFPHYRDTDFDWVSQIRSLAMTGHFFFSANQTRMHTSKISSSRKRRRTFLSSMDIFLFSHLTMVGNLWALISKIFWLNEEFRIKLHHLTRLNIMLSGKGKIERLVKCLQPSYFNRDFQIFAGD